MDTVSPARRAALEALPGFRRHLNMRVMFRCANPVMPSASRLVRLANLILRSI